MLRGFLTLGWVLPSGTDLLDVIDQLKGEEQVIMVGKGGRRFKVADNRDKIVKALLRFRGIRTWSSSPLQLGSVVNEEVGGSPYLHS